MQKRVIKTDLALVDEAKSIVNELNAQINAMGNDSRAIIVAKQNLSDKIDKLRANITQAKKIVSEYNSQLKALGVNEPTTIVNTLTVAIDKALKDANTFEKQFFG